MLLLPNYFLQENVLSIIIHLWDNVWVAFDFMLKTIKV